MKALRRGWYLGDPDFKDRLTALFDKEAPRKTRAAGAHQGHGEADAERLSVEALAALGLPPDRTSLAKLKKGEWGKVLVAVLLRERTAVGNPWIAERLCMGHHGSVSRPAVAAGNDKTMNREKKKLEKMLKCVT